MLYADSYTLSGCGIRFADFCGVFTRVPAHCTAGANCPGGANVDGISTNPTLCDGAPVYQIDGAGTKVLLREFDAGHTNWLVSDNHALVDCYPSHSNVYGEQHPGRLGYAPTAPVYGQYQDNSYPHAPISVTVGGRW